MSIFELSVDSRLRRSGGEVCWILPSKTAVEHSARSNMPFIRAAVHAPCRYEKLICGELTSQPAFAKVMGVSPRYVRKIRRCAFPAPDIVELILSGHQPVELTLEKLLQNLPLDWVEQRKVLGLSKT